jgi:hypothetical protein
MHKGVIIFSGDCSIFFLQFRSSWIKIRGGNRAGRVLVRTDRIGFWVEHFRVSVHSGRAGSGFGLLLAQVISSFGSFGSGSSQVSDHLISGNLGFQVILDRVLFCDVLFQVGSNFGSGRVGFGVVKTLKKIQKFIFRQC